MSYLDFEGSLVEIGAGPHEFAWDNEHPRKDLPPPLALADRATTNGKIVEFIADGGY